MSETQFFQTRIGRQYYEVTLPELVRQLHRMNDLLALGVEMIEKQVDKKPGGCRCDDAGKLDS